MVLLAREEAHKLEGIKRPEERCLRRAGHVPEPVVPIPLALAALAVSAPPLLEAQMQRAARLLRVACRLVAQRRPAAPRRQAARAATGVRAV